MNDEDTTSPVQRLLKEADAARYLGVSRIWLRKCRSNGPRAGHADGPEFIRAGRMIRYSLDALDAWIARHTVEV